MYAQGFFFCSVQEQSDEGIEYWTLYEKNGDNHTNCRNENKNSAMK